MAKTIAVVFGGRYYTDYEAFKKALFTELLEIDGVEELSDVKILEGGAGGTDAMAKRFAQEFDLEHIQVKAEWGTYGKAAGPIRNRKMAEVADVGVGFHDGKSRGTASMIREMEKAEKPLTVINY